METCPGDAGLGIRLGRSGFRIFTVVLIGALGGCAGGIEMFGLDAGAETNFISTSPTTAPASEIPIENRAVAQLANTQKPSARGASALDHGDGDVLIPALRKIGLAPPAPILLAAIISVEARHPIHQPAIHDVFSNED